MTFMTGCVVILEALLSFGQAPSYQVSDLEFYECPACGEELYDRDAMRKIEAHHTRWAKSSQTPTSRAASAKE